MRSDSTLVSEIRSRLESKSSDELLELWKTNDRSQWSDEAFAAARDILISRQVEVPEQQVPPTPSLSLDRPPENVAAQTQTPLVITATVGSTVHRYAEPVSGTEPSSVDLATAKTRAQLRADILKGILPRDSKVRFERGWKRKTPHLVEGPLYTCARRYPDLLELYKPVRRYTMSGMKYGILVGIALHLVLLGYLVTNTRLFGGKPASGLAIFAIPVCAIITWLSITNKLKIPFLIR